jgi:hypothetical protein
VGRLGTVRIEGLRFREDAQWGSFDLRVRGLGGVGVAAALGMDLGVEIEDVGMGAV